MNEKPQKEVHLIRNLHDARFSQEFVEHFMDKHTVKNLSEQILLLNESRSTILNNVNAE